MGTRAQTAENLRVVQARFEAHQLPSTDLLEARALDAKARADQVTAIADALVAIARLQALLGLPVQPSAGLVLGEAPR